MAWGSNPSPRNRTRPSDWRTRRATVLRRAGGQCAECSGLGADEVDHVIAVSQGGSHELDNLRAVHGRCVRRKNAREAQAARKPRPREARPPEAHPGLR
jgi:5-methylcytosine-specific restriction endonuclease McrA